MLLALLQSAGPKRCEEQQERVNIKEMCLSMFDEVNEDTFLLGSQ